MVISFQRNKFPNSRNGSKTKLPRPSTGCTVQKLYRIVFNKERLRNVNNKKVYHYLLELKSELHEIATATDSNDEVNEEFDAGNKFVLLTIRFSFEFLKQKL